MSESIWYFELSLFVIRPIAIPETGAEICTPPSISARVPAQTVAIEDDPLDSRMSETTRMAYGHWSLAGSTGLSARSARFPWPISLRLVARIGRASPVLYGGK